MGLLLEIYEGGDMFLRQFEVSEFLVFAYLVGCPKTGSAMVIDPADEVDFILDVARKNGLKIEYIVNTHGHIDHVMGNKEMKEKTGAKIMVHKDDARFVTKVPSFFSPFFKGDASPPADILLNDNDVIKIGELDFQVIHTPGHSPGSICIYRYPVLFTGDTLFVEGIGRTDTPGGSYKVLLNSIKSRIFTLPDDTIVLPGHNYGSSPTSTIMHEKMFNPFLREIIEE